MTAERLWAIETARMVGIIFHFAGKGYRQFMKIIILDGYTENPGDLSWEGFEKLGELTVYDRTPIDDPEEILRRIADAEIVLTNKTPLIRDVLTVAPNLKYIGVLATGFNIVDTLAARELSITVTNIPAYSTNAVAQLTFALLLEICHNVGHHSDSVKAGRWCDSADFCFWDMPLMELSGKTMGIVGFGRIGEAVGRIAAAFGMSVLACNTSRRDVSHPFATYVEWDELCTRSDIISLHCPLSQKSEKMINSHTIAQMKDGVILINTARGGIIAEQDLADALNSGKVYAAGLDVLSCEPAKPENPLLSAKNCFITPHIAWAPKESRARLMNIAVQNLQSYLDGKTENVVNP